MRTIIDTGDYGEYLHYGAPLALVTTISEDGRINVSTNASISPLPGDMPRVVMGVLTANLTNALIARTGEFVINVLTPELRAAAIQCGRLSGIEADKLTASGLTTLSALYVKPPLIKECPLNIECRVESVHPLGDLDLWVARVLVIEAAPELANGHGGVEVERFQPLFYAFGRTFQRGPMVGSGSL